jgi:hypothetical protein
LLRGEYRLIGKTADTALFLVIKDPDTGAVGAEDPVSQVGGQLQLKAAAALATESGCRQGIGAALGADRQFQVAAAVGAIHIHLTSVS